jgi:preprotein translocase subunit SecE
MEAKSSIEKIKEWPKATKDYITELKLEMKRVTWPNRKQVESTTAVVIFAVFAFAAYFAVVDLALDSSVTRLFKALTR